MTRVMKLPVLLAFAALVATAEVSDCGCDVAKPETLEARQCALCREAEKHPPETGMFFLKDSNPRKPNRWLLIPRAHWDGEHPLDLMTPEQRTAMWAAAIEKAKALWGDEWGIAMNGDRVRTQCHPHVHIGKLLQGIETPNFIVVTAPEQIPATKDGLGLWIHPQGNKLHVHLGEQITETVLLR
jgi:hypothetical protein